MLNHAYPLPHPLSHKWARGALHRAPPVRQAGVVLVIALIVLVAMTLAGLALVRSVDTTNIIAGNLAFRQAATHAGDRGIEAALACLAANNTGTTLENDLSACGYTATSTNPAAGQSWGDFWTSLLDGQAVTLSTDAAGNTVKYVIQRLCQNTGPVAGGACSFAPPAEDSRSGARPGSTPPTLPPQVLYRITSQVTGPRSTTSYVQAIVAL